MSKRTKLYCIAFMWILAGGASYIIIKASSDWIPIMKAFAIYAMPMIFFALALLYSPVIYYSKDKVTKVDTNVDTQKEISK